MAFTFFLGLFAIVASVVVFFVSRQRMRPAAAAALSLLTFLSVAAASILFIGVALSNMNA